MARKPQKSIQVRMDEKLKNRAEKVFQSLGLDTPTAIRIFFTRVVMEEGIPFDLSSGMEKYSAEQLRQIDEAFEESLHPENLFGPFNSVDEMYEHMKRQTL